MAGEIRLSRPVRVAPPPCGELSFPVEIFLRQRFRVGSPAAVADAILRMLLAKATKQYLIVHVNLHSLYLSGREPELAEVFRETATFALFEGTALQLACLLGRGIWWPDVNGSDLVPYTLVRAPAGTRVALVGGQPTVAARAAKHLIEICPGVDVVLAADGFRDLDDEAHLLRRLVAASPDCLLLGLGSPRQEVLGARWRGVLDGTLIWCVGGLFDQLSGDIPRAPVAMRRLRLEWLWRLVLQPKRTWRRIFIEGPWLLVQLLLYLTGRS